MGVYIQGADGWPRWFRRHSSSDGLDGQDGVSTLIACNNNGDGVLDITVKSIFVMDDGADGAGPLMMGLMDHKDRPQMGLMDHNKDR